MKIVLVLCGIFALSAASPNRIVGGENAAVGQIPYIASLRGYGSHFCGATIISKRTLLTAAHCKLYDVANTVAVIGTTKQNQGGKTYQVKDFIIHPNYQPSTISNDIGVVILTEDIELEDGLIETRKLSSGTPADGKSIVTAGWGLTSYPGNVPNDLQWFNTKIMSHKDCSVYNGNLDGKICTLTVKGQGVCSGDSGGPLVDGDEVVGVTSAAYLCALGMPDFFTDVYTYRSWVEEHTV